MEGQRFLCSTSGKRANVEEQHHGPIGQQVTELPLCTGLVGEGEVRRLFSRFHGGDGIPEGDQWAIRSAVTSIVSYCTSTEPPRPSITSPISDKTARSFSGGKMRWSLWVGSWSSHSARE